MQLTIICELLLLCAVNHDLWTTFAVTNNSSQPWLVNYFCCVQSPMTFGLISLRVANTWLIFLTTLVLHRLCTSSGLSPWSPSRPPPRWPTACTRPWSAWACGWSRGTAGCRCCWTRHPASAAKYQHPSACLEGRKEGNVLFNDALNTFYFTVIRRRTYGKGPLR